MNLKPLAFFSLLGLLVAVMVYRQANAPDGTLVGSVAPEFEMENLNGERVSLSGYQGQLVFLNFWATWCPSCVWEMPAMMEMNDAFKNRPFRMVTISVDTNWNAVRQYYDDHAIDLETLLDPGQQVKAQYRVLGFPETFLIDGNGYIVRKYVGPYDWTTPGIMAEVEEFVEREERRAISVDATGLTVDSASAP